MLDQGRRSKIESGKAKFYGQLLARFVNRINISTILESNSVLKGAHTGGLGTCPQEQVDIIISKNQALQI